MQEAGLLQDEKYLMLARREAPSGGVGGGIGFAVTLLETEAIGGMVAVEDPGCNQESDSLKNSSKASLLAKTYTEGGLIAALLLSGGSKSMLST